MLKNTNLSERYKFLKRTEGLDQKKIAEEMGWLQSTVSKFMAKPYDYRLTLKDFRKLTVIFRFKNLEELYGSILMEEGFHVWKKSSL